MSDILHDFAVRSTPETVYPAISSPAGLDAWWTVRASGKPEVGAEYTLWFGPEADWRATVVEAVPGRRFVLELTSAAPDWLRTRVGFSLEPVDGGTMVRFSHSGWAGATGHFRISSYCWAMYLRLMRRYVETGDRVPYADRLGV